MNTVTDLQIFIEKQLKSINYPINSVNPESIKKNSLKGLYDPIEYSLNIGGKRIRPILLLMAYQIYDNEIERAIAPALGIEIFHNFTLLHDDIMDNSRIRRMKKTVHEKWDVNTAILSGDTMLIQAYQQLLKVPSDNLESIMSLFNKTAIQVCEGQFQDMYFEKNKEVNLDDYLQMIEYKTAVLLACSLKIGAILGGASKEDAEKLYDFGIKIGIAFQLQDDFLDVFGKEENFGKQIGRDILANKRTFLYLKACSIATDEQRENLQSYYNDTKLTDSDKVEKVKLMFKTLSIEKHTQELIEEYYNEAFQYLDQINTDNKEQLLFFIKKLIKRVQ